MFSMYGTQILYCIHILEMLKFNCDEFACNILIIDEEIHDDPMNAESLERDSLET